jgi:hypothetical protein
MAALIPNYDPSDIPNDPERVVAEALCAQLPKDVRIFHSYPWLRKDRDLDKPWQGEVIREGEADFVIVDPRFGFMVIEVKGGHMFYEPGSRRWDRRGATHAVKDPFEQASRNMFVLEKMVKDRSFPGPNQLPFVRTRAVVFPDCDYQGTLPPGAAAANLFGAKDLAGLGGKIETLFNSYAFKPDGSGIGKVALDGILKALTSTFRLVPALWREVEDQDRQIFRLTEQQAQVLDFLGERKRAEIHGVAGSGKTKLAMIRARRFADDGKSVLFVCFNSLLAEWLQAELPEEYTGRITIRNYHKLCAEWAKEAGLVWPSAQGPGFWKSDAPRLFERALDLLDRRFDAVVVDEAQDFETEWWDGLELVNVEMMDGLLFIFHDPAQRIFSDSPQSYPALGEPFVLPVNCRNTERISKQCGDVIGKVIPVRPGSPEGREPVIQKVGSGAAQAQAAEKQVKTWLHDGLKPNQIAVVTAKRPEAGCLHGKANLASVPVTENLAQWRAGKAILVSTVGKFKGLEADAMVLTDVPPVGPNFRKEHLYVAYSRAKHLLTVVCE